MHVRAEVLDTAQRHTTQLKEIVGKSVYGKMCAVYVYEIRQAACSLF